MRSLRSPSLQGLQGGEYVTTRILSVALLLFLPLTAAAQTADEIVKKALEARGGVDKLKAVQTERVTGRITFSRDVEGTFVVELKRPLKMHVEISIEGQRIIRVYDGKSSGWMINLSWKAKTFSRCLPKTSRISPMNPTLTARWWITRPRATRSN